MGAENNFLQDALLLNDPQFSISEMLIEKESGEYKACSFQLNGLNVKYRLAKITPKKTGQFVTFWKRTPNGTIGPFEASDNIALFIIDVRKDELCGQFVFPAAALVKHGILSGATGEGKRAMRVYPPWDMAENKQAKKTQHWQLQYFIALKTNEAPGSKRIRELYAPVL